MIKVALAHSNSSPFYKVFLNFVCLYLHSFLFKRTQLAKKASGHELLHAARFFKGKGQHRGVVVLEFELQYYKMVYMQNEQIQI